VIRAVIFDLGDTLVRFDNRKPHQPWEARLGLAPGSLWETVNANSRWHDAFLGGDEEQPWLDTAAALGLAPEELPAFRESFFACERPEDDLVAFASGLRPRYRTAILSDAPASTRRGTIRKFGLDNCFDAVLLSGEIGVAKPDARAFAAALDALGVSAEEAAFVDDRPANLDAARGLGMAAVRCVSARQTIDELADLLSPSQDATGLPASL